MKKVGNWTTFTPSNETKVEDEYETVCIHCVLKEQKERIDCLEIELMETHSKLDTLIKLLELDKVRQLR